MCYELLSTFKHIGNMRTTNHESEDDLEKLRIENELKNMKMILEQGAIFSEPSGSKTIDPFLENECLRFRRDCTNTIFYSLFSIHNFSCPTFSFCNSMVKAVTPLRPPNCMVSNAELGTTTIVEFCFNPS